MKTPKPPLKLIAFDAAKYLADDDAIAEYMSAVHEAGDPDLLRLALGDAARAAEGTNLRKALRQAQGER